MAAEGGQGRGEARHLGLPRPPHPPAGKQDITAIQWKNCHTYDLNIAFSSDKTFSTGFDYRVLTKNLILSY